MAITPRFCTSAAICPKSWLRDLYDRAATARADRAARPAVMHDLFEADPRDLFISTCDFDSIADGSFRR